MWLLRSRGTETRIKPPQAEAEHLIWITQIGFRHCASKTRLGRRGNRTPIRGTRRARRLPKWKCEFLTLSSLRSTRNQTPSIWITCDSCVPRSYDSAIAFTRNSSPAVPMGVEFGFVGNGSAPAIFQLKQAVGPENGRQIAIDHRMLFPQFQEEAN